MLTNKKLVVGIIFFIMISTVFSGVSIKGDNRRNTADQEAKDTRGFHDYDSLTLELQNITANYPGISNLYDLGQSVQGRTIWGLKITDNPDIEENEPEVRICGCHHGDEKMSLELPLLLAWHMVENYTVDPLITDLIDNRETWIIPLVNPDGRMAYPPQRRNANNVDLNRDYGYIWEGAGSSPAPFSQPETQVIRQNALENNYVLSLSFHTSGDVVNYLWNHKGTPVADHDVVVNLSEMYGSYNGYWVVEGYDWYRITGDTNDFSYGCRGDLDWTIEVQDYNIPEAWDLNRDAMVEIIDASNMGLTGIVTDNDTGQPIAATVWVEEAYWPCFTDSIVGDYHKPLLPGNYTVHFRANTYEEKVYSIEVINSDDPTVLNVSLDRNNEMFAYQVTSYYCFDPFPYDDNYQNNPTEGISALGPPDNISASIGKGGEIVLDMGQEGMILNSSGDDFIVYDGDSNPEGYYVEASEYWDGPWISLGYGTGTSSFDLADENMNNAQFIKIIDDDDGDAYEVNPGFDLDAIQSLNLDISPKLSYDPMSVDLGVLVQNDTVMTSFEIWNSGAGMLNYTLSEFCDWVSVAPMIGNSSGEHDTINVSINTTSLDPGLYHCDIIIDSNGGSGVFGVDLVVVLSGTEFVDVNQSVFDRGFPIRHAVDGDWAGAQNFTATVDSLTRAELYLRKFGTPEFDLTVELREDNPTGTLLDTVVFTPSEVSSSWGWLNVNFTDVTVTPGTDYFIVVPPAPSGVTTSFGYEWGYAFGNQYDDGSFWFTRDGGALWRDLPTMYEFSFRTYGY